jgi:glycosyltransferase involved in cell wall biosynthesis
LQIEENKLGNCIQLLGFRSDIKSFLNSIDIFLFPSLWEGFGFALVEAMAEKVVPVAFDLTSNPEIISHGKDGFLIKHPDIDSFADRIEFLITNPEQRQLMANSASEQVRTRFDLPQIVKEWEQLLN